MKTNMRRNVYINRNAIVHRAPYVAEDGTEFYLSSQLYCYEQMLKNKAIADALPKTDDGFTYCICEEEWNACLDYLRYENYVQPIAMDDETYSMGGEHEPLNNKAGDTDFEGEGWYSFVYHPDYSGRGNEYIEIRYHEEESCIKVPNESYEPSYEIINGILTQYTDPCEYPIVIIPEGVKELGVQVFHKVEFVESIQLPSTLKRIGYGALNGTSLIRAVIPPGVTEIGYAAFGDCAELRSIFLPDSIRIIEYAAFYNCILIEEIRIPSGVTVISEYCFYCCRSLKRVTLPASIDTIRANAFNVCPCLKDIYFEGSPEQWAAISKAEGNDLLDKINIHFAGSEELRTGDCGADGHNLIWTLDSAGTLTVTGKGAMQDFVFNGTSVNPPWEEYRDRISTVIIGNGVTGIGDYAFYKYNSLKHLILGSSVKTIGFSAFNETSIADLFLPDSLEVIKYAAFGQCLSLKNISFPIGEIQIEETAFCHCRALANMMSG